LYPALSFALVLVGLVIDTLATFSAGAPPVTILDALDDPNLLGAAFPDAETWRAWRAFLAAVFGLRMTEEHTALYRQHTGRQTSPTEQAREAWVIAGRRAGKSRIAALLAVFVACFRNYKALLAPGEKATVAVIAADRQQARAVFRYITGLLDAVPMLCALVVRRTASAVELRGGVVIEVHTCSYREHARLRVRRRHRRRTRFLELR